MAIKKYNGVEYDTDVDYSALEAMAKEVDPYLAQSYEQRRNAKILGEGLNYETTDNWSGFDWDAYDKRQAAQNAAASAGSFSEQPQQTTQYQDALNGVLSFRDFSYDAENDPRYRQYAKSYTRNGQTASDNTLAQVSARTGGLASSYAQQAAQQTYNGYMQALNDKVPELYQLAYSKYMDEFTMAQDKLSAAGSYDSAMYHRSYQEQQDAYNQQQNEYRQALELAQLAAKYGDYSGLNALGIDTSAMTAKGGSGKDSNPTPTAAVTQMSDAEYRTYYALAKTNPTYAAQILSENYDRLNGTQKLRLSQAAGMSTSDLKNLNPENAAGLYSALLNTGATQKAEETPRTAYQQLANDCIALERSGASTKEILAVIDGATGITARERSRLRTKYDRSGG